MAQLELRVKRLEAKMYISTPSEIRELMAAIKAKGPAFETNRKVEARLDQRSSRGWIAAMARIESQAAREEDAACDGGARNSRFGLEEAPGARARVMGFVYCAVRVTGPAI